MKFLVYLILFNLISATSWAQFQSWSSRQGPVSLKQKSDNNYKDIWSLSDWFEVQRKNRLMDQWLAMNSTSNPFEFYLGAQTTTYDSEVSTNGGAPVEGEYRMNRGEIGAYASIIGLEGEYIDSKEDFTSAEGSINIRLLGRNAQGTNLTGFYGIRTLTDKSLAATEEKVSQNFAGGSLTLNLTRYFGVIGKYKKYFKEESNSDSEIEGDRLEGSFFIDFAFVRAYGTWYQEKLDYNNINTSTTKNIERTGIFYGLKLWF